MKSVASIDLGAEGARDETTGCKLCHLLEKHKLGKRMLVLVNEYLRHHGIKVASGAIIDATITSAPSSTKNKDGERDNAAPRCIKPQMSNNVSDVDALSYLLHGGGVANIF